MDNWDWLKEIPWLRLIIVVTIAVIVLKLASKLIVWVLNGGISVFFQNLNDELNKLFKSIRKFAKEKKLIPNTIRVVFIIFLFWYAGEVGGNFYSFLEVVYSLLIVFIAFYVIYKADW